MGTRHSLTWSNTKQIEASELVVEQQLAPARVRGPASPAAHPARVGRPQPLPAAYRRCVAQPSLLRELPHAVDARHRVPEGWFAQISVENMFV